MVAFAWLVLFSWPVVSYVIFRTYSLPMAVCATIFGGYLLLPSVLAWDLPLLPPLDKYNVVTLSAFIWTIVILGDKSRNHAVLPGWLPRNKVALVFLSMLIIGAFGTVLTNRDALNYGPRFLPGLQIYDAFSVAMNIFVVLLPILFARKVLYSLEGHRILLKSLIFFALAYTLPALWEVRMSPQLHTQIYGFFPSSFAQQMRDGGFRPVVFLNHGLALALFFSMAAIGAAGMMRDAKGQVRLLWALAGLWLLAVIVLTKSLGPLLIVMVLLPITLFVKPRLQLLVCASIAVLVMSYPILRAADVVPLDGFLTWVEDINPHRAKSLETRIENEEALLEKAKERQVFGWGGWGRNRVYNEDGYNLSITDGSWIVEMGQGGWFRYLPVFGLLCWPVLATFLTSRCRRPEPVTVALALVLSAKLVDLIPNSGYPPFVWLLAGALLGRLEAGALVEERRKAEPLPQADYQRDPTKIGVKTQKPHAAYARTFDVKGRENGPGQAGKRDAGRRQPSYKRFWLTMGYRR